jgi:amino acid transporter
MGSSTVTSLPAEAGVEITTEARKLKRELTLLPLFGLIYFTVCGGTFGIEPLVGYSGPGLALLLIAITPIIFSLPNMLMVRELNSMMPAEGGYYHWVKQAFGPFTGFMAGWNNWIVSWLDVPIYAVLAAYYLGYFFPALRNGATIGGTEVSADLLSWFVAAILILLISLLQIRGARLTGLTTNWIGIVMIIPVVILTILGLINWIRGGASVTLPFLPQGESLVGAFSVGLFVVMWNYMGWELPTVAGDEIVNPKRTYPRAMLLVLIATIATYALPVTTSLYGGAGVDGRHQLWGVEGGDEGIGPVLNEYGVTNEQMTAWGVDPASSIGWELPEIGHAVAEQFSGPGLAQALGSLLAVAAVLSMTGLFIGNSLGGTRVPFALAEDGMMPKWMVKVHDRFGTPWVAILVCGVVYALFSLNAFAFLVVADVFLQLLVVLAEFAALWVLRFKMPHIARQRVPGGYLGLTLVTLGPLAIILLAIVSQYLEAGFASLGWALALMALGVVLYYPLRRFVKPGVPDVDPFRPSPEE